MILSYWILSIVVFFIVLIIARLLREYGLGDWMFRQQYEHFMTKRRRVKNIE